MADISVSDLLDQGYKIEEEIQDAYKRRTAVRTTLRNLVNSGLIKGQEKKEVEELYPERKRNASEPEPAA